VANSQGFEHRSSPPINSAWSLIGIEPVFLAIWWPPRSKGLPALTISSAQGATTKGPGGQLGFSCSIHRFKLSALCRCFAAPGQQTRRSAPMKVFCRGWRAHGAQPSTGSSVARLAGAGNLRHVRHSVRGAIPSKGLLMPRRLEGVPHCARITFKPISTNFRTLTEQLQATSGFCRSCACEEAHTARARLRVVAEAGVGLVPPAAGRCITS